MIQFDAISRVKEEATMDTSWPPVEYRVIEPAGDPFTAISTDEVNNDAGFDGIRLPYITDSPLPEPRRYDAHIDVEVEYGSFDGRR